MPHKYSSTGSWRRRRRKRTWTICETCFCEYWTHSRILMGVNLDGELHFVVWKKLYGRIGKDPMQSLYTGYYRTLWYIFLKKVYSNDREKEATTYMLFLDLMYDCEEKAWEGLWHIIMCTIYIHTMQYAIFLYLYCADINLQSILAFFKGAEAIPSTGLELLPTLRFSHANVSLTVSTCALSMTLPTCYHDKPVTFQQKTVFTIKHHGGFGYAMIENTGNFLY